MSAASAMNRPKASMVSLPILTAELPGVRRKLHNLAQRTAAKRAADRVQLVNALARITTR